MSKNKIFIFFVLSFLFGIFFWNIIFNIKLILVWFCIILMLFLLLLLVLKRHHFFVYINILWIFLGLIYCSINNYYISQKISILNDYTTWENYIEGEIIELYKKSSNYNSYMVKIISFEENKNFNFNFLLYTNTNLLLEEWQIIGFTSKIDNINNFADNFNYIKFMQSKNIYFSVNKPNIEFIWQQELWKLSKIVRNFRKNILYTINEMYPKNEAVFLAGLLIWAKENLSLELQKDFNNSGLTHIISVSWFNITIIIIFLWFLFKFFPLFVRTFLIFTTVIFFVLLVWNGIAVIRATIMWLVGYFIIVSGRKADSLSLLLLTAFLMVLYNPLSLNYDISFHLSFLAVLWLLYFQNFWNHIFRFIPSFFAIKEWFVLTMSAMTTTLPIMIFNFWQVSILAPIANMLVGGIIPFAMLFWLLSIIWQMILEKIGFVIWFINYFLLNFIINIAHFFWNLDFSVIHIDMWIYAIYSEILYFMILIFWIIYFKQEKSPKL